MLLGPTVPEICIQMGRGIIVLACFVGFRFAFADQTGFILASSETPRTKIQNEAGAGPLGPTLREIWTETRREINIFSNHSLLLEVRDHPVTHTHS